MLPNRIFFTGVPGSHWSAISRDIEQVPGINTSDQGSSREYNPGTYSGHRGAYFGTGMEFSADIEAMPETYVDQHLSSPWKTSQGTKILKSHEWAYKLPYIRDHFPNDWIILVYRPDLTSQAWWHEAGGFKGISYPDYAHYKNSTGMLIEIMKQNEAILQFACQYDLTWSHYSSRWLDNTFETGFSTATIQKSDILVTVLK